MLATLSALTLPDVLAWLLVGGLSVLITILAWPLLRRRPSRPLPAGPEPDRDVRSGLAGQWLRHTRRIEARIEDHKHAVRLHRKAAQQLGALDFELDRLLRDMRAIMLNAAAA